jgi:predicted neuraminidase
MQDQGPLVSQNIEGHDVSPTTVDFDGDLVADFIGGAEDGRFYFLKNPQSAIMQSEFIYDTAPFPSCHASSIVELQSGDLVATWFGGTHEKHPDVGIWVSRYQNGKWSPPQEVANGVNHADPNATVDRYPTWNPVLFQTKAGDQDGPLMLYYKVGPSPQTWWGMSVSSNDSGQTWSPPKRLPASILGPIKNKPIQLTDGAIVSPSSTESDEDDSKWQVHFERSTDGGMTWTKIGPVNDGVKIEAIQPSILTLSSDRLLSIGRSRQDRIFEIESNDKGQTWGPMRLGSLPNNNSGIDAVTMQDGQHAIVYNHVGGTPGQWGGKRSPLNLSISQDGHEWQAALVLESDPGEYSYPAIIQSRNGLLHITYTWRRQRIKHVVVDPSHLRLRKMNGIAWPNND